MKYLNCKGMNVSSIPYIRMRFDSHMLNNGIGSCNTSLNSNNAESHSNKLPSRPFMESKEIPSKPITLSSNRSDPYLFTPYTNKPLVPSTYSNQNTNNLYINHPFQNPTSHISYEFNNQSKLLGNFYNNGNGNCLNPAPPSKVFRTSKPNIVRTQNIYSPNNFKYSRVSHSKNNNKSFACISPLISDHNRHHSSPDVNCNFVHPYNYDRHTNHDNTNNSIAALHSSPYYSDIPQAITSSYGINHEKVKTFPTSFNVETNVFNSSLTLMSPHEKIYENIQYGVIAHTVPMCNDRIFPNSYQYLEKQNSVNFIPYPPSVPPQYKYPELPNYNFNLYGQLNNFPKTFYNYTNYIKSIDNSDKYNKKLPSNTSNTTEFFCSVCDRSFYSMKSYDYHIKEEHIPCNKGGCTFSAPFTLLEVHKLSHILGKSGIPLLDDPEESSLWIQARKLKYPLRKEKNISKNSDTICNESKSTAIIKYSSIEKLIRIQCDVFSSNLQNHINNRFKSIVLVPSVSLMLKRERRWRLIDSTKIAKKIDSLQKSKYTFSRSQLIQEYPICFHYLKYKNCKWNPCHYSHDTNAYRRWQKERNRRNLDIPMRPPVSSLLLIPEVHRAETLVLKALQYLVRENFFIPR